MEEIYKSYTLIILVAVSILGCNSSEYVVENSEKFIPEIIIEAEDYITYDGVINLVVTTDKDSVISTKSEGWLAYDIELKKTGLYQVSVITSNKSAEDKKVWIEDHYNNKDNRIFNIGELGILAGSGLLAHYTTPEVSLNEGIHKMKFHFTEDLQIDKLVFRLIDNLESMPVSLVPSRKYGTHSTVLRMQEGGLAITSLWSHRDVSWLWVNKMPYPYSSDLRSDFNFSSLNFFKIPKLC